MRAIILLLFVLPMCTSAYAWEFGIFDSGEIFVYDICDYTTMDHGIGTARGCYILEMQIIEPAESSFGPVWIAHVSMSTEDYTINDIILIDDSFNVYSFHDSYISASLSNTLFWMNNHAGITYLDLSLGDSIPATPGFFEEHDVLISDFNAFDDFTEYEVSFSGDYISGEIWVRDDATFPDRASIFSVGYIEDKQLFTIQLVSTVNPSYTATDSTNNYVCDCSDYIDGSEDFTPQFDLVNSDATDDVINNTDYVTVDDIFNDTVEIDNTNLNVENTTVDAPKGLPLTVPSKIIPEDEDSFAFLDGFLELFSFLS